MKKLILFLFLVFSLQTQSQEKESFWENVQFGGGVALAFGNQTTIGFSPSAIYSYDNGLALGIGGNYFYSSVSDFTTSVYGLSFISIYQTNIGIQLSSDLEYNFARQRDSFGAINRNFPSLHIGIAYNQGRFAYGIRYDVLYNENRSVFASPISPVVRFYF